MKENWSNLRVMHEKYQQGDDARARLQSVHQEYRTIKKLGRHLMLPPQRCRLINRIVRSEAYLTLSYYTALKPWLPHAIKDISPLSAEVVRRKHIGSEAEYVAAQRRYRKLEKYKRVYASYMDRQRIIEVLWADKGLFQTSFQKPRQVSLHCGTVFCLVLLCFAVSVLLMLLMSHLLPLLPLIVRF